MQELRDDMREASIGLWHTFTFVLPLWLQWVTICGCMTLLLINLLHVDTLVAPILKIVASLKGIFYDPLLVFAGKVFASTSLGFAEATTSVWAFIASITKNLSAKLLGYASSIKFEAWLGKKGLNTVGRFLLTTVIKWAVIHALLTHANGSERKGVRKIPQYIIYTLKQSRLRYIIEWWGNASKPKKQLIFSIAFCIIFVIAGQAVIGYSILAVDLLLNAIGIAWRHLVVWWKYILPFIVRILQNSFLGFLLKVVPVVLGVVPFIRDDFRVHYIRMLAHFHVRARYRMFKKSYMKIGRLYSIGNRGRAKKITPKWIRSQAQTLITQAKQHEDAVQPSQEKEKKDP